jgi:phenylacetic acid degradation operon negative regulatory protein
MRNPKDLLSTIRSAPISQFIYSSLSFVGRARGGELPGMWFVCALTELGRDVAAIRQTLFRMEQEGELLTRKVGRSKFYRASPYAEAEIEAGLMKIFTPPRREWDGRWTLVTLALREPVQRVERERIVALLAVEGFALAGNDVYVHPRAAADRLVDALPSATRPHVIVIRGALENPSAEAPLVALWHVQRLAVRYREVEARLRRVAAAVRRGITERDAFALRFAVVLEYLGVAWDDPDLPPQVLPDDWPGDRTRRLAAELYERLRGPALRHADRLLASTATHSRAETVSP